MRRLDLADIGSGRRKINFRVDTSGAAASLYQRAPLFAIQRVWRKFSSARLTVVPLTVGESPASIACPLCRSPCPPERKCAARSSSSDLFLFAPNGIRTASSLQTSARVDAEGKSTFASAAYSRQRRAIRLCRFAPSLEPPQQIRPRRPYADSTRVRFAAAPRSHRSTLDRRAGPSAIAIATARFNSITGDGRIATRRA